MKRLEATNLSYTDSLFTLLQLIRVLFLVKLYEPSNNHFVSIFFVICVDNRPTLVCFSSTCERSPRRLGKNKEKERKKRKSSPYIDF